MCCYVRVDGEAGNCVCVVVCARRSLRVPDPRLGFLKSHTFRVFTPLSHVRRMKALKANLYYPGHIFSIGLRDPARLDGTLCLCNGCVSEYQSISE